MGVKGAYNTRHRGELLDFFRDHHGESFSARDIIERSGLQMGEATVYRFLSRLTAEGKLCRTVKEKGGVSLYSYNDECGCTGHMHLRCLHCNSTICTDNALLESVERSLQSQLDFSVDDSHTTLYGVCGECRRKEMQNENK